MPNRLDAERALSFLAESGVTAMPCKGIEALRSELSEADDIGCVVLVGDSLTQEELPALHEAIESQPAWSDMPFILIAPAGSGLSAFAERMFPNVGSLTLLEQPLNPATLVSAVRVALRAREHQLQVHTLIEDRDQGLRMRDEFLAMLAHELRNPLAPMRNAVYLQNFLRIDDPIFVKTREIFDRQVTNMSRMVDDLIDIARLERGKLQLQREHIDLNAVVAAAIETSLPIVQARRHRIEVCLASEPLFVHADPVRIEQLVTNLVTNAAKFTPEAGEITVSSSPDDGSATVSVRDNGAGLSEDMLTSIFKPFIQADRTLARSSGGLGLGLTIAHRLAVLHGGALQASSAGANKGSTFVVRLPLVSAVSTALSSSSPSDLADRRLRVLVVEDNSDIRESIRMILERWGHEVTLADTGQKGLDEVARSPPQVALIDIGLPMMDGYELARAIRASSPSNVGIKLIAITGYGQPGDRHRALESGFDAHMLKPIDPKVLQATLSA
jgi:signal transduction histidine kinase/CheY-like chemotaxis protein